MQNNRKKGNEYEERAVSLLQEKAYRILARNFRTSIGEIDVIAEKDDILVFVEVKYRKIEISVMEKKLSILRNY